MRLRHSEGQFDALKAGGLQAVLDDIARMAPVLKSGIADVKSWDDMKLFTVAINRLRNGRSPGCFASAMPRMRCRRWAVSASISPCRTPSRPQTCLQQSLTQGAPTEAELDAVQATPGFRCGAQRMQVVVQDNIVRVALKQGDEALRAPLALAHRSPPCLGSGNHRPFSGLGVRPEHVHSPAAGG